MADVFISYSKQDRALAETLAAQLKADGLTVWWDTDLVSGDQFRQVILDNLNAAKQVVVIWTPNSVKSEWVISEATRAAAQKKLVPVKIAALAIEDIPPPFDLYHTVDVSDKIAIRGPINPRRTGPWLWPAIAISVAAIGVWWWQSSAPESSLSQITLDSDYMANSARSYCQTALEYLAQSPDAFEAAACKHDTTCMKYSIVHAACLQSSEGGWQAFRQSLVNQFAQTQECNDIRLLIWLEGPIKQTTEVSNGVNGLNLYVDFEPGLSNQNWTMSRSDNVAGMVSGVDTPNDIVKKGCALAKQEGGTIR